MRAVKFAGPLLLAAFAVAGCESTRPSGVSEFYSGNYVSARAIYEHNARAEPNSRALYLLRLGTLELDGGNVGKAREYFADAAGIMEDFKASGQFKAIVGSESSKEYKGDPYEQMMALWYLGVTDYMVGQYNMALPSFKSAALADGGTTDERYRADAASVFLMMARAYHSMGDEAKADEEYREAAGVYTFRETVNRLTKALSAARSEVLARSNEPRAMEAAHGFLSEGVSAGATEYQDPTQALGGATDFAFEKLEEASKSRRDEERLLDQDPNIIGGYIKELSAAAGTHLTRTAAGPEESPLAPIVRQVSDPARNLLILVGLGPGPFKYRAGEYGEMAKIGRRDYPERFAEVFVDGAPAGMTETVEDIYYQASTRGGRAMDSILRGRAVFKDVTKVGTIAALAVASTSEHRRTQETALIAAGAMLLANLATRPEADIRSWETLPDKIQVLAVCAPPGRHSIEVRFYGAGGYALPGMTRSNPSLEVKSGQDTLVYVRAGGAAIAPATAAAAR